MGLIAHTAQALPDETLDQLRSAVARATRSDRLGGRSPYHYTFWYDLRTPPRNLVEAAVREHLVHHIPAEVREKAVGVEWWLGRLTPPYASNFEFGLHRDIGEDPETMELVSPTLSSVMYLTEVADGPLLVFGSEPTPDAADREHVFPAENLYVTFPGHLWHAVGNRGDVHREPPAVPEHRERLTVLVNWWTYRPGDIAAEPMKQVAAPYDGSMYPELRAAGAGAQISS
ncbi:hypothetical protein ABZY90_12155 [Streptomyces sp. NPDC006422]|uniref:hypothetical protein n=1 Tax=unclassified Streptomyces TaxID=2593676 RepID=UPI0033ABBE6F